MKKCIPLMISIISLTVISAAAGPFDEANSKSLYTDIKAHKIGDILTVIISENARASNKAKSITKKSTTASVEGGPGIGGLDFFAPFGMAAENESEFDGEGRTEKDGSLTARMTVKVVGINPNGDLLVEGHRILDINNDQETLFLSGIVREKDITPANTIYSFQIGDAEISYKGKGQSHDGSRPGFFTRLVNWLF
ncbi:MAG: flagellar basal body L-ring protein FlgH [Candidatus Zixiibacteriota bacterium]|nr:MAG: flagellar basal body L-ring protein FlgH [candidate division Zixibacteria bacterium]